MGPEERDESSADDENPYAGIHHAAFATSNLAATVHFWRDLLGLRPCLDVGTGDSRQIFFGISPGAFISFFIWSEAKAVPRKTHGRPVRGSFAFDHISIGVRTKEALLRLQTILEESGHPVSDVIDHGFVHSVYTFDPNGIAVEFSLSLEDRDIFSRPFPVSLESNPSRPFAGARGLESESGTKGEGSTEEGGDDYFTIPGSGSDLY